jgi:protoporphyrinogen oxidase
MPHLTILGGGIAGLSTGYFARKKGLPVTIYEARDKWGGNCITLAHNRFRFDSGAHRFHDKEPAVTEELKRLPGTSLRQLVRPSKIFSQGDFVAYPVSPISLLDDLGTPYMMKAAADFAASRFRFAAPETSFEDGVINLYGKAIAERFFLGYTEKLWGVLCHRLQPGVAAKRFRGFGRQPAMSFRIRTARSSP